MAIEFIEAVWQISPYKAERLLVQLACADWANADGEFWPTYDDIAHKARVTKPGAIGIIQQLIEDEDLILVEQGGSGRGHRNRYRFSEDYLNTVVQVRQTWAAARERKGKRALPKAREERVNELYPFETERVNENAIKGKPELSHIRNNRHEPSEERESVTEIADSLSSLLCELHGISEKSGWQMRDRFQSLAIELTGLNATIEQVKAFWASRTKSKPALNYFAGDFTTWRAGKYTGNGYAKPETERRVVV